MSTYVIVLLTASLLCLAVVVFFDCKSKESFDVAIPMSLMASLNGGDVSYFPKILTTQATEPESSVIEKSFKDCIARGSDTVKGCLTSSGAGFRPGMCMNLCATQYGDLNKYCSRVCNDQQSQVNTSARFGPA